MKIILLSLVAFVAMGQGATEAYDRFDGPQASSLHRSWLGVKGPRPLRVLSAIGTMANVVYLPQQRNFHSNYSKRMFYTIEESQKINSSLSCFGTVNRWENNHYQNPTELLVKAGWGNYEIKTFESEGEPFITFTYAGGSKDLADKVRISWVNGVLHICAEESYSIRGGKIYFPKTNTFASEEGVRNPDAIPTNEDVPSKVIAYGIHSVRPGFFLSDFKVIVTVPRYLKVLEIDMKDSSALTADKIICDKAVVEAGGESNVTINYVEAESLKTFTSWAGNLFIKNGAIKFLLAKADGFSKIDLSNISSDKAEINGGNTSEIKLKKPTTTLTRGKSGTGQLTVIN